MVDSNRLPVRSRYADGTPVFRGQKPPRISDPDPAAIAPHSVLRWDSKNNSPLNKN